MSIKHRHTLNPILAVQFYHSVEGALLILAGEGPFLKVIDAQTSVVLNQCQIFDAQAIHGIEVRASSSGDGLHAVIWGGCSLSLLSRSNFDSVLRPGTRAVTHLESESPDWVLSASPCPSDSNSCVLITAHNCIVRAKLGQGVPEFLETHSPSRSILYSASLAWKTPSTVIVAAGTVFGEIIVWTCTATASDTLADTQVLFTFTGHEGSIFGVDISPEILSQDGIAKRLLASCSDDRTIRIWDISDAAISARKCSTELIAPRETGFGTNNTSPDSTELSDKYLAMSMGHASRIWGVKFKSRNCDRTQVDVFSFGEDSTTQQWRLDLAKGEPSLHHSRKFAHHTGKHIWTSAFHENLLATGGADGKIVIYSVEPYLSSGDQRNSLAVGEESLSYFESTDFEAILSNLSLQDFTPQTSAQTQDKESQPSPLGSALETLADGIEEEGTSEAPEQEKTKSVKKIKPKKVKKDAFNRYAFTSKDQVVATTNFGRILRGSIHGTLSWEELCMPETSSQDLRSYSVVKGLPEQGLAFLAGANGKIYLYQGGLILVEIGQVDSKVADLFPITDSERGTVGLLVTVLSTQKATMLYLTRSSKSYIVTDRITFDMLPNFVATSANHYHGLLFLGSRDGTLAAYDRKLQIETSCAWPEKNFGAGDAITCITDIQPTATAVDMYNDSLKPKFILTTDRRGRYSIYYHRCIVDADDKFTRTKLDIVHLGTPPLGPMLEHAWFQDGDLILCGFRSKNFVVWNETKQCEIVTVECGGGHRSYAYSTQENGGGTFFYTKASKLCFYSQPTPSHRIVKQGGHGREIKACAVSTDRRLVATGAEDTCIRIWQYEAGASSENPLECLAVTQKHTTGIQSLLWHNSNYLFSSGGNEEFYVWAIRSIPGFGIGILCEASCPDQSEDGDLRITSFDVSGLPSEPGTENLLITLAYSDSTIRVYRYSTCSGFLLLAKGRYTSSCITQIRHLSTTHEEAYLLSAATDGVLTLWKSPLQQCGTDELIKLSQQKLHQNSIKALDIAELPESFVVASGGDDDSIGITLYKKQYIVSPPTCVLLQSAHAAAVTALNFLPPIHDDSQKLRIVSASNDQRVKAWNVSVASPNGGLCPVQLDLVGDTFTPIADVGDIAVLGQNTALVVGNGMELWTIV